MKITVIGCGLRTPLLIHGIARSDLGAAELALYDIHPQRAKIMAALGQAVAAETPLHVAAYSGLDEAIDGASFVISSIRVGDMEARARDERIALEHGLAGQETTGPGGLAMALRTVPVAIEHARMVARRAPKAWVVNFTNPAGLITQAIANETGVRVVGICDTPAELFYQISLALNAPLHDVECDYFGLNHLGWVRRVRLRGEDVTERLLSDATLLRRLYPADLFSTDFLQALQLIPSEYLFFYYNRTAAFRNQRTAGATRGEEILKLNQLLLWQLEQQIERGDVQAALQSYRSYLNRRNASYLQLEATAGSALTQQDFDWNPFQAVTGYHRIAVEAMRGLSGAAPVRLVLNVANGTTINDLAPEDVVEVPAAVTSAGPIPHPVGNLPEAVRGLVVSVKTYERLAIRAAMERSAALATLALSVNPIVGEWTPASRVVQEILRRDPDNLGAFLTAPATPAGR